MTTLTREDVGKKFIARNGHVGTIESAAKEISSNGYPFHVVYENENEESLTLIGQVFHESQSGYDFACWKRDTIPAGYEPVETPAAQPPTKPTTIYHKPDDVRAAEHKRGEIKPPAELDQCFTGANRSTRRGRGMPCLLPFDALESLAIHFEGGVLAGYDARNWELGMPLTWYVDSIQRHLGKVVNGFADEPHARSLAWNTLCMLATILRIEAGILPAELDDLPKAYAKVDEDRNTDFIQGV